MSALVWTPPPKRFLGAVAGRCSIPNVVGDATTYAARMFTFACDNLTHVRFTVPNFYVPPGTSTETATGGTLTVNAASIEYPAGKFHRVYWGGSVSTTIASGSLKRCDLCPVNIPRGAKFWIHTSLVHASSIPYNDSANGSHLSVSDGDSLQQTATDLTMTGGEVDQFGTLSIRPCSIEGWTTRPSFALIGDSRQTGLADTTVDSTGGQGEIGRSLGLQYAVTNMAVSGERAVGFAAGHALRGQLMTYCTHVLVVIGINDISFDVASAATVSAAHQTLAAIAQPRRCLVATIAPHSSGAWTDPTGADQTTNAGNPTRSTVNDTTRGSPGLITCVEIADYVEITRNGGKWKAPGYTGDGLHELSAGNLAITIPSGLVAPSGYGYMPMA